MRRTNPLRALPGFPVAVAALSVACATLGTQSTGGVNLPTSDVGPFRKLGAKEVLNVAPYVLDGLTDAPYEQPAVLPLSADPASMEVAMYVDATVKTGGVTHGAIVRTHADDGVSFYGTALDDPNVPELVLDASEPWEEGSVHSPGVLRAAGGQVYLYYAAGGGIGLATSTDGLAFTKKSAPVLVPDPSVAWETTLPTEPSVAVFPDGSWHMLYAAGVSIGEATSADGLTWTRVDGDPSTPSLDPVLSPSPPASAAAIDAGTAPFDTGQVADPCLLPRVDPAGALQVRVLYTGYATPPGPAVQASAIGFAARYGDAGALAKSGSPVYSVGKHEAAPALFEWSEGSLLYVHEDSSITPVYPAIAGAVFPVTLTLPHPSGYASSP
jgi:hypothetical protein